MRTVVSINVNVMYNNLILNILFTNEIWMASTSTHLPWFSTGISIKFTSVFTTISTLKKKQPCPPHQIRFNGTSQKNRVFSTNIWRYKLYQWREISNLKLISCIKHPSRIPCYIARRYPSSAFSWILTISFLDLPFLEPWICIVRLYKSLMEPLV